MRKQIVVHNNALRELEKATTQDYSYTNMYLMSTVNAILFGEIVGGDRGKLSAAVGYTMFDKW